MKHITLITALTIFTLAACDNKPAEKPIAAAPTMTQTAPPVAPDTPLPPGHPSINANSPTATMSGSPEVEQTQQAVVVSSIDVPQFTYLEIKQDNQTRWLTTSTIAVKKGDAILFDSGSTISNFNSKALNRTFPSITFVNHVTLANKK